MKRTIAVLPVLLVAVGLAVAAAAAPAPTSPAPATPPVAPNNYVLGPGDQIQITVFDAPDLSRTVTITPDGTIDLPLINSVHAAGKTASQLEADLTARYAKYLRAPSVSVSVLQFHHASHIYVMGEVQRPGRYDLLGNMTLLDALAAAGGATGNANLDGTRIARVENGKTTSIPVKMNQLMQGKNGAQNLQLQNGDLIYVPRRGMSILEILGIIGGLISSLGL
jgi:polysaccharide export outer membrane protein